MSEELKSYPTCKSIRIAIKRSFMHRIPFYAECQDCGERGPHENTIEVAITAWNTRAGEKM